MWSTRASPTQRILGFDVVSGGRAALSEDIREALRFNSARCLSLVCINPHSYVASKADVVFRSALNQATWLIPDGVGISIAARILNGTSLPRVTGYDAFEILIEVAVNRRLKVFFLGSSELVLAKISQRVAVEHPDLIVSGVYSPPYSDEFDQSENAKMLDCISAAGADILFVAMTAPKQEKWAFQNLSRLDARVVASVGAVFEFYAGTTYRAGPFFQRLGLEWLPRLVREPRRLWKRMAYSAPEFVFDVLAARFSPKRWG